MAPRGEEIADLLKRAFALPVEAPAALAGSLLDTLDDTVDKEASWKITIAPRIQLLDAGTAKTVPGPRCEAWMAARLSHRV